MSTPAITPSPYDLTTLQLVKAYAEVEPANNDDNVLIQDIITAFGQLVTNQTGVACFNKVASYTENRDGNGNQRLFLRNRPIVSVTSLTICGSTIPQSDVYPAFGYMISDDKTHLVLRGGSNIRFITAPVFTRGVGNIQIVYTAGYTRVPFDLQQMATKVCSLYYKRRATQDLKSKAVSAGGTTGTTMFQDWAMPPECADILEFYSRTAVI